MENLGIPFRTILRKIPQLGIPFRATKNKNKLSECRSEPFRERETNSEPVFLNVYGARESIPRNEFLLPAYVAWRAGTITFPHFLAPIDCLKSPAQNKTSQPNISIIVSEKTTFDIQTNQFVKLLSCCFVKLIFSAEFHSVPFRSELRNWLFRGTRNSSE